ncbi:methyltransferase [Vogesella sp. EB]|jgi:predicted O-methyltransferase YrrM|uniref:Putative O-methyltransferase YrrM n=1 Tax=Vogesella indigofera TaxID=45465 RepID=A0A495BG07_VOGIN|nr:MULTISPECIES: class I SAM-dependent methyltransferase [Vogesella]KMJ53729.1 methyltransferase [Vogesella sp. EB]MCQ4144062.1 class I SAM-dependent methyltransferase [Vogesella sp. AC12]MDC7696947.1 class I SAM-dependent methyltransferase [Vogesella indigofera]RKQ60042.1 putative O-methyltransferase YrrM [Vogesella indigofera]
MTRTTIAVDDQLAAYLLQIGVTEHPVQTALREFTATHRMAKMQISPEQGQFLAWLVKLLGVRRYLEIGVFTGYSALTVALAMGEQGRTVACDMSVEFTTIARDYWRQAGVEDSIALYVQPAVQTLQMLLDDGQAGSFDLAFIDADKTSYPQYYEACLQLVRPGGVIAVDNIFLNGRVVSPKPGDPPAVRAMQAFNASLKHDPRVVMSVLPIGDGMTLLTRR